jgi:predicted ATPase
VMLELARRVEIDYDAVVAMDLIELRSVKAIEYSLISALGIAINSRETALQQLITHLRSTRVLLALDNCEHLAEAAGDVVAALLEQVKGLSVLVTSRRPLEIGGEHVLQVPPLALPPEDAGQENVAASDAVVLLMDRAAAAGRPVAGDHGDGWTRLVELVRWSGGLPLVLELIAVRLGDGLSPAAIMQRLDGGKLLTIHGRQLLPHHRALSRVLDWSYELCSAATART